MYCLMPSDNFIVKISGTQAGIEPTTFGVPTHCFNHWATEALVTRVAIGRLNRQSFYFSADCMNIARTLTWTCGDPYRCNGFPNLLTESYNLHGCSHMIVSYNAECVCEAVLKVCRTQQWKWRLVLVSGWVYGAGVHQKNVYLYTQYNHVNSEIQHGKSCI